MPRLSEKDKEALCASEAPSDRPACKLEYDLFSDYQDAKKAGTFTGDFNEFKKQQGVGVVTWGSAKPKPPTSPATDKKSRTGLILGLSGIGVLVLIAVIVAVKRNK